jgi:hypothetical protein
MLSVCSRLSKSVSDLVNYVRSPLSPVRSNTGAAGVLVLITAAVLTWPVAVPSGVCRAFRCSSSRPATSAALLAEVASRWRIGLDVGHVIGHHMIRSTKTCPGSYITPELNHPARQYLCLRFAATPREITGKTRGQNGVASPFPQGSCIPYNVPVYPGALRPDNSGICADGVLRSGLCPSAVDPSDETGKMGTDYVWLLSSLQQQDVARGWWRSAKRTRALLESNPRRNSRLKTHRNDGRPGR